VPAPLTYPGVYIEEVASGVRTITGVATSVTAFVGRAARGPVNLPIRVQSFAEFERNFGGLSRTSTLGYAVQHFFLHGGSEALIVRVFAGDAAAATATLELRAAAVAVVTLQAASAGLRENVPSPGSWGDRLEATVDYDTRDPADTTLFNLTLAELDDAGAPRRSEVFRNLSTAATSPRFIASVLSQQSSLARVSGTVTGRPDEATFSVATTGTAGDDGSDITVAEVIGSRDDREGIYALENADLFNLLCVPPPSRERDWFDDATTTYEVWAEAAAYCRERRAFLVIDPREDWAANSASAISNAVAGASDIRGFVGVANADHAALYFPRLTMPDPLDENRLANFAPCGAIAGIMARTDAQRGVWKAPAGLEASFSGVRGFSFTMNDLQNGQLNPLGVNCLRTFPVTGNAVWGARTLAGADQLASEWKYIPVRRLALFLEESLYRGTQWVVFEPNDEPLWAQIRLNVGAFLQNLFRQGAFQGRSPREAYFVKCDRETTTQDDINRGIVNVVVGFAPLKPAEFVVIKIQQLAGQIEV
jgi:phage tail sheath protein FI